MNDALARFSAGLRGVLRNFPCEIDRREISQ
jgi:hypothetical protein